MDESKKDKNKKILKSKATALSKGKKVPSTVFAGLANDRINNKIDKKLNKTSELGGFKKTVNNGTTTPFGLKKLPCRPVFLYQTPKSIVDNTVSKSEHYKPKGFATEKFLSFPRNDFVI